jgi:hypothetical protein
LSSVDPADDGALGAPKEADLEFATVEFNNVEEKEDEDEPRRGRKQNIAKIDETRHRAGAVSGTYEEEFDQDKDLPDFNPLRQRGTVGSRGWIDRWAMVALPLKCGSAACEGHSQSIDTDPGGGGCSVHQVAGVVGFAAVGGFLFGYDTGVVGGAILLIQEQFDLSSLLVETVISIALVGTDPILHTRGRTRARQRSNKRTDEPLLLLLLLPARCDNWIGQRWTPVR